jgi:hypothetical protein
MRRALFTCCEKPNKLNSEVTQHNSAVDVSLDVGEGRLKEPLNLGMFGFVQKPGEAVGLKGHIGKPSEQRVLECSVP